MVTLEFIVSEKTEGQTDKKTYKHKQTNKLDQSQDIVTGNAYVLS